MNTTQQYEEIKQMGWYQKAEANFHRRLHLPKHWWVMVWQKSKKWTGCIKCGLVLQKKEDLDTLCRVMTYFDSIREETTNHITGITKKV